MTDQPGATGTGVVRKGRLAVLAQLDAPAWAVIFSAIPPWHSRRIRTQPPPTHLRRNERRCAKGEKSLGTVTGPSRHELAGQSSVQCLALAETLVLGGVARCN